MTDDAPPVSAADDDAAHLVSFLQDRDVSCPGCRYNLRDLKAPRCPECDLSLRLTVGATSVESAWLVLTIIPCAFSGMCAFLLAIPVVVSPIMGAGPPPVPIILLDLFGWISGIVGVGLFTQRHRFIQTPRRTQIWSAAWCWSVHFMALIVLFLIALFS